MNCTRCGKELSGGLDTYGMLGAELCFECHFTPEQPPVDKTLESLLEEVQDAKSFVEECEWDFIEAIEDGMWEGTARNALADAREHLDDLLDMVSAHKRASEREAAEKVARWARFAVGVSA